MLGMFQAYNVLGGQGRAVRCAACGHVVTYSDQLFAMDGRIRHFFVNPEGIGCDFYTFTGCPGVLAYGAPTEAHTWFSGYAWRIAFCAQCYQHLGWSYVNTTGEERPTQFWGILVDRLTTSQDDEEEG